MTFKSPLLLLYVLSFAVVYFGLGRRRNGHIWAPLSMLLFSIGIYAPWGLAALCVVLAQAGVNCAFIWRMDRAPQRRKALLAVAVGANILLLCWSKYSDALFGLAGFSGPRFATPPGLSFLSFIQIAMLVEVGLGRQGAFGWLHTLRFQLFFPTMLSGPIARYGDVGSQLAAPEARLFSWENASAALYLFSLGLFKKIILADSLAPVANQGFALGSGLEFLTAWACTLAYTLQIYFDFSGYSDMAIGMARLFNVTLPDNFQSPYKARNIQDFWRRWHMTLGLFMRDYVYIPLGGGRRGLLRKCLALMIVFLVVGAWHGVGWTFMVWGALHGAAMAAHSCWRHKGLRMPGPLAWVLTFLFVHCAWVFFRAPDMASSLQVLAAMAGRNGASPESLFSSTVALISVPWPTLALIPLLLAASLGLRNSLELTRGFRPGWAKATLAAGALALGLLYSGTGQQFLYFQF